ncbi:MAG TPA: hypothetical protein PKC30_08805 [Saprospiraceae bacterium]|nr:hypothetical protein [Saprospiraceae bacterium]
MKKVFTVAIVVILMSILWHLSWNDPPPIKGKLTIDEWVGDPDSLEECFTTVVGVQAFMETDDYASAHHFYSKMRNYLHEINDAGILTQESVVVFPEHIGTWLVGVDEKNIVYSSGDMNLAMVFIALRRPLGFLKNYLKSKEKNRPAAALFRLKSHQMAHDYFTAFSSLAIEYGVYIVGGSIVLEEPEINSGQIITNPGRLYNVSGVFSPKGFVVEPLIFKSFPTSEELEFISHKREYPVSSFENSQTTYSILICADSWYPEMYRSIPEKYPDWVLVPSFAPGRGIMEKPWSGYNGHVAPEDVMESDVGYLTEEEAWDKYALEGRLLEPDTQKGMNIFMKGKIWNMVGEGSSKLIAHHGISKTHPSSRSAILFSCSKP